METKDIKLSIEQKCEILKKALGCKNHKIDISIHTETASEYFKARNLFRELGLHEKAGNAGTAYWALFYGGKEDKYLLSNFNVTIFEP